MKRIFLLLAVVLAIFCFGSVALAEGLTLGGDLTFGAPNNEDDKDFGYLTIDGNYEVDSFVFGGSLLACVYVDPPLTDTQEAMTLLYGVYGGYEVLSSDNFSLAALAGYYFYSQDFSDSSTSMEFAWDATSLMAGVKAAFNADPISVSLTYMYGVSNESNVESDPLGTGTVDDPAFSWFELKCSYALNEAWSIYGAYRGFSVDVPVWAVADWATEDAGSTSFGAGVTYKF